MFQFGPTCCCLSPTCTGYVCETLLGCASGYATGASVNWFSGMVASGTPVYNCLTNASGYCCFGPTASGPYAFSASGGIGYKTATGYLNFNCNAVASGTISLALASGYTCGVAPATCCATGNTPGKTTWPTTVQATFNGGTATLTGTPGSWSGTILWPTSNFANIGACGASKCPTFGSGTAYIDVSVVCAGLVGGVYKWTVAWSWNQTPNFYPPAGPASIYSPGKVNGACDPVTHQCPGGVCVDGGAFSSTSATNAPFRGSIPPGSSVTVSNSADCTKALINLSAPVTAATGTTCPGPTGTITITN